MITRRCFTTGLTLMGLGGMPAEARAGEGWTGGLGEAFRQIEAESGGRLGVAVLDTADGTRAVYRPDERFALCSTAKLLTAGAVLKDMDAGRSRGAQRLRFTLADVVAYSPVTKTAVGGEGMTLDALCAAALTMSDNTAANLLLAHVGGPVGWTRFVRALGDTVTRLDRNEPDLNEATPGDPRDTTTPSAMVSTVNALVFGDALSAAGRERLVTWLKACTTGGARVRSGVPVGWTVGDKTGTGGHGSTSDVAVLWPPGRHALVLAVYLADTDRPIAQREATIASVARAVARAVAP